MYNDNTVMPGENIGETFPNNSPETEQSYRAAEWESAMGDADEFQGEWGYGERQSFDSLAEPASEAPLFSEKFNQDLTPEQQVSAAGGLAAYGFNEACRNGSDLNTVLNKIYNTDITSGDAVFNPIGKIYEAIEPRPEARAYLFREIQKDIAFDREHDNDPDSDAADSPLGMTPYGDFYDKRLAEGQQNQTSIDAILAMKKLLDALATDARFEPLRERARREGKSVIDVLVGDTVNPTITTFLNGVNGELSGSSVEEVLDQIEEESAKLETNENGEEAIPEEQTEEILEEIIKESPDSAVADAILAKFNQGIDDSNKPITAPKSEIDSSFLSDDDFQSILNDESNHLPNSSEFDSEEIIEHLKNEIPLDFEEVAKLAKARKSGEFPVD